ncbi:MAG: hypothetical protein IT381_04435 [Deltaproteobacteria bacterium]|nr:hypothetical protein [Deltaproteobacteria bacterium]
MSADDGLDEAEIRKILALAAAMKKKTEKVTLADLKESAADIGLTAQDIDRAAKQRQQEKKRRRAWLGLALVVAIGMWAVAYLVGRSEPPIRFNGESKVTITSGVKDGDPVDVLKVIRLASRRDFNVFVNMYGVEHLHRMRCDIVGKADGKRVYRDYVELLSVAKNKWVNFAVRLPWDTPPGDYEVQIYADEQLINEEPLPIALGTAVVTTAKVLQKEMYRAPLVTKFKRGADETIYARIDWDDLRGTDLNVEFRWYDADKTLLRRFGFPISKSEGNHWAWDPLPLAEVPNEGEVRVEARLEGVLFGEAKVSVEK